MIEIPFVTTDTSLSAYLILQGFFLLEIQYEPRSNGKQRGIFIFKRKPDIDIDEYKDLFESGQASINVVDYNRTKQELLDRVMRGLP